MRFREDDDLVISDIIRVVRQGVNQYPRLYVNGVLQPWAIISAFSTEVHRNEMPEITLTIASNRIELTNDLDPTKE
jgi:hypothetical protein